LLILSLNTRLRKTIAPFLVENKNDARSKKIGNKVFFLLSEENKGIKKWSFYYIRRHFFTHRAHPQVGDILLMLKATFFRELIIKNHPNHNFKAKKIIITDDNALGSNIDF
jgi:hypothetical protein